MGMSVLRRSCGSKFENSKSCRVWELGLSWSEGKAAKSKEFTLVGLALLASERIWFTMVNGVNSPTGSVCWGVERDRTGVMGWNSTFAAEEKKSPVRGGYRSGVTGFPGVLKSSRFVVLVGVGVVGRVIS